MGVTSTDDSASIYHFIGQASVVLAGRVLVSEPIRGAWFLVAWRGCMIERP
jgi:hypothetical protein